MRTGTVLISVVVGLAAGLGRLAYRSGLTPETAHAAERRAVLETVEKADVRTPAEGPSAPDDPAAGALVVEQHVEIHGPSARVHRTYENDPAVPGAEPVRGARSFVLQRTDDGTWEIIRIVRHVTHDAGQHPPEQSDG